MKPIVYFSREITPEKVLELYRAHGKELPGKIAVKVHSGEEGNQNFLHPEFWKSVVDAVNGTVVECNTAYAGSRNYTEQHRRLHALLGKNDHDEHAEEGRHNGEDHRVVAHLAHAALDDAGRECAEEVAHHVEVDVFV